MATTVRMNNPTDTCIAFTVRSHTMSLRQDPSAGMHGKVVWDGGLLLAAYFDANRKAFSAATLQRRRALELGSGCGVAGIAFAACGCRDVTLTDLPDVVPLLQKNIDANLSTVTAACFEDSKADDTVATAPDGVSPSECVGDDDAMGVLVGASPRAAPPPPPHLSLTATPLEWGCTGADAGLGDAPFDYVFASDVVFSETLVPALMDTLASLCGPSTAVLLANEFRCERVQAVFKECAARAFVMKRIPTRRLPPAFQAADMNLQLFQLRLKRR